MRPETPPRRLPTTALLAAAVLAAGCASTTPGGVPIDTSLKAVGQDSRVLFLVLHYTAIDLPTSIKVLTQQQVSSHYLLSDAPPFRIYRLVDEGQRAWHSGASFWKGNRLLNSSSIGIEIVHPGFKPGSPDVPDDTREFQPFSSAQIDALLPLVKDIAARHQIQPERILGHGEVSPSYKVDPGPTFPWQRLAAAGITPPWPDAGRVAARRAVFDSLPPDIGWAQRALAEHGYNIQVTNLADEQTRRVLMNFQMRYRPARYDGLLDAESAAVLDVLTGERVVLVVPGAPAALPSASPAASAAAQPPVPTALPTPGTPASAPQP